MGSTQRKADFDELYQAIRALPEGITGEILMDGRIETMGRPGEGHTRFAFRLGGKLLQFEDDPSNGWVFRPEREIRIALGRLVVPDVAGWRVHDEDTSFLDENPVTRVPDWTCEILSESTRDRDRDDKLPLYLRAGVGHVWLVDPDAQTIEGFVQGVDGKPVRVELATGSSVVKLSPFGALPLDLRPLWLPAKR
jgi:Uma2 family endonuclease